ncbi:phosphate ABC transporter permease [Sphingobacteriaceae bacterium]|nr:phosphate ABC transporter permease [Sphingobacteriaceae bacterium]
MEFEIKPQNKLSLGLKELWEYRELFYFFTLRDIKVKYKQTVLGFLWAVLQPLIMALLFSFFLGKAITNYTALDLPYDIFALSGLVIWGIFSSGLNNAGNSMVSNANIIKKIYFPRLIIPISSVLVGVFDFVMAFAVFIIYTLLKGIAFNAIAFIYFPLAILLTCVATFGAGSLLAALNVKYRDFRYIIPFLIQLLLFLTPVIYPVSITNNIYLNWILALNPMTAPLDIFRASLEGGSIHYSQDLISITASLILFITGLVYFRKTEAYFADLA